jgi:hypothetical protein
MNCDSSAAGMGNGAASGSWIPTLFAKYAKRMGHSTEQPNKWPQTAIHWSLFTDHWNL